MFSSLLNLAIVSRCHFSITSYCVKIYWRDGTGVYYIDIGRIAVTNFQAGWIAGHFGLKAETVFTTPIVKS